MMTHPGPLNETAQAMLERQAKQNYLRDLDSELEGLQRECHSPALDRLVAHDDEVARNRTRKMSDRQFQQREELLTLTIPYKLLHTMIEQARSEAAAGEVPAKMVLIRRVAGMVNLLRLGFSDRAFVPYLSGQKGQESPAAKRKKWDQVTNQLKAYKARNPRGSYSQACEEVAGKLTSNRTNKTISASWVRKLVPKQVFTKL